MAYHFRNDRSRKAVLAIGLLALGTLAAARPAAAAPPREIRSIFPAAVDAEYPRGIAFSESAGELVLVGGRNAPFVKTMKLTDERPGAARRIATPGTRNPSVAFDERRGRVVLVAPEAREFVSIDADRTAAPGATVPVERAAFAPELDLGTPDGAVFDERGTLYVLDRTGRRIVVVSPGGGEGTGPSDLAVARPGFIPLRGGVRGARLRGLALDPDSGNFVLYDDARRLLVEVDRRGFLVEEHDLGDTELSEPLSLAFAPSGDPTDAPDEYSLYVLDARATVGVPESTRVVELSFSPIQGSALAGQADGTATNETSTLLQSIALSELSPPSPDPAGVTYRVGVDRLLVSDSEVNEIPTLFENVNLFSVTRDGALQGTGVTTAFSDEPTGLDYHEPSGRLFVSDDDDDLVTILLAGADGVFGSGDDSILAQIATDAFGSTDPEGVAYDSLRDEVVVVDGLGREIYRVGTGPDGAFGTGDDSVDNFDLQVLGSDDPEGLHYDASTDTLLVAERGPDNILVITAAGALLRTIDISAAAPKPKAAGITLAPASAGPNARSMYIVDRGTDNDSDPNENDGVMYEMSFSESSANRPPSVGAGPDQVIVGIQTAQLDGTVEDDGQPAPPGELALLWSAVSGPGPVSFADATAADTTVTFSGPGVYTLRLTASDSALSASDDVTVSVSVLDIAVAAGSDDAEEFASGRVSTTGADLELVADGSRGNQTVGVRFVDVAIPPAAVVTAAWVQFQADETDTVATDLTVQGEASDDASTFENVNGDITRRSRTNAAVSWSPPPWNTIGEAGPDQRTPDLSAIVQEIVDRGGWAQGNALAIIVTGTGTRTAEAFDGAAAPVLHVEFDTGAAPANRAPTAADDAVETTRNTPVTVVVTANDVDPDGNLDPATANTDCAGCTASANGDLVNVGDGEFAYTPDPDFDGVDGFVYEVCDTGGLCDIAAVDITVGAAQERIVEVRVATGSDDAEQRDSGRVSTNSSDLEFVVDSSRGQQIVGMRFTGVGVPAGARIDTAWVQFQADERNDEPTDLTIEGQASANPPTFTTDRNDIGARPRTAASQSWSPPPWTNRGEAGPAQRTVDIAATIQEIVDQPGWSEGQAMVLIITGSGTRTAESFDGQAAGAPLLHIEFSAP